MAWGWHGPAAGPGVVLDGTGLAASRPTDGGGGTYAGVRGVAGRRKGRRYFEIEVDDGDCAVGFVNIAADLNGRLGNGADPLQWGFWAQDGLIYYRVNTGTGSADTGAGASGTAVYGILIDFDTQKATWYKNGVELYSEYGLNMPVDTVLYPAASMDTDAAAVTINGSEPFQYPPAVSHIAWDIYDMALGSRVGGILQVNAAAAARTVKAFSFEKVAHSINNEPVTESKTLGQTVSDGTTGAYEIILRDGYPREVFVVAFDDYGEEFEADASVAVNDRVHPNTPNGYVYECTGAGDLPSTEPDPWPTDPEAGSQSIGTASFEVKPFYRPQVHGPIKPDTVEIPVAERPLQIVMAAYQNHGAAVQPDGTLIGWGSNTYGEATPPSISNCLQIGASNQTSFALDTGGNVAVWGRNIDGLYSIPSGVQGAAIQIDASRQNACALKADGTVAVWGNNSYSQASNAPAFTDAMQVNAGFGRYGVVRSDGTVHLWGVDFNNSLAYPVAAQGKTIQIAMSKHQSTYHGVGLLADGTVVGWGQNNLGQATPPAGLSDVIQVAAGLDYCYALKADGTLVSWGGNSQGQRNTPAGIPTVVAVSLGYWTTLALDDDGLIWYWGASNTFPVSGTEAILPLPPIT